MQGSRTIVQDQSKPRGPDLLQGVISAQLSNGGTLIGHIGDDEILLVRQGTELFAVGAHCTHYHGPLADGIVIGDTVCCPWHHACFNLRNGESLRAPAIDALPIWRVEERDGRIFVHEKYVQQKPTLQGKRAANTPDRIVIVGGEAAGFAAAEMLRRREFKGSVVMLSDDDAPPVDRPNLSKDYLAGNAPEDWLPLRPDTFYSENGIDLHLKTNVSAIDARSREVLLSSGNKVHYDRLLIATGAEPVRLSIPGANQPHVHTLRTLADSRAIIERAKTGPCAVVLGASFIGLEVAAALKARGIDVHVIGPEKRPMERILGPEMGDFVRALHEEHGVVFHLEDMATAIGGGRVNLKSGGSLAADLVIVGVGVRPRIELAENAGLAIDRGVAVNAYLETSAPGVFAAGDIARWPDVHSGERIRVEHWVVAERQGPAAALNMLGQHEIFDAVPFFWSQHYDIPINYVGHAEKWDQVEIEGNIAEKDCRLRFKHNGRPLAVASIFRDVASLQAEVAMERRRNEMVQ